jgi:eukaryotic-like serine/threonine-protein kinase
MSLAAGARLGPYQVLGFIGAGGMGEVYKARDTRLDRTVAIKVLPDHLSDDPVRRARFEREAKSIAGLTHPNVCTLHDVGEHAGSMFLVMELLDGETLAQRLERGPLPIEQAVTVTTEIADALSAAHRHGIIHRDLKPSNVMLTKSGAKLLDFGLAKLAADGHQAAINFMSATRSAPLTGERVIVGTLHYMAPEQLEGNPTDARTDLWAFGAVVYEMLTGKRAFDGTSAASLMGAILEHDPVPAGTLQPLIPPRLDTVVRQCLAKAPEDRWQSARDLVLELEGILSAASTNVAGWKSRSRSIIWWTVATASVGVFVGGTAVWVTRPSSVAAPMVRLSIPLPDTASIDTYSPDTLAIAPDGSRVAFIGHSGSSRLLYMRRMADLETAPVPGTDLAEQPLFSPDGDWIAFFASDRLKKVSVTGGPVSTICVLPRRHETEQWPNGGDWGRDGRIIFAMANEGLYRVSANGGVPERIASPDPKANEVAYGSPQILPDRDAILYTVYRAGVEQPSIAVMAGSGADHRTLLKESNYARYVAPNLLLYLGDEGLFTMHFDAITMKTVGTPSPVSEPVFRGQSGNFAVSASGTLVYVPGPLNPERQLVWVDRQGHPEPVSASPRAYRFPRLSPDGQSLALEIDVGSHSDLWIHDFAHATLTKATFDGDSNCPVWSADGEWLLFGSRAPGVLNLFRLRADGTGRPERILTNENEQWAGSVSPNGQLLVYMQRDRDTEGDLWKTALNGAGKPEPVLIGPYVQWGGRLSPDGRWLAYTSNESRRFEVYVTPFPGPGPKWQVSTEGGQEIVWSRNGRELFYRNGSQMMAVPIEARSEFRAGKPVQLFDSPYVLCCPGLPEYDVSLDGQRFIMLGEKQLVATHLNVVLNWKATVTSLAK